MWLSVSLSVPASRSSGPRFWSRSTQEYVRTMKLVQNGTITATSSSRCARGGWREMKYASEKPSTAQAAVAPSERNTLRSRLWR